LVRGAFACIYEPGLRTRAIDFDGFDQQFTMVDTTLFLTPVTLLVDRSFKVANRPRHIFDKRFLFAEIGDLLLIIAQPETSRANNLTPEFG
jgi:hypothetical protein